MAENLIVQAFSIYGMNIEAIQEAVFSQHSLGHLCLMNQLNDEQNPQQHQDK